MKSFMRYLIYSVILLFLLISSLLFSGEILFEVKDNAGNPIMSVQDDGIYIMDSTGTLLMTVNSDSIRFGIDAAMQRSFAVQQSGDRSDIRVEPKNILEISNANETGLYDKPMMLWYPSENRNAFRVGHVYIEHPDSVGVNSFASGYRSRAIGDYSSALGNSCTARGENSLALGAGGQANGQNSMALGCMDDLPTKAIGYGSVAIGTASNAIGNYSFASGLGSQSAIYSVAMGRYARADGDQSIAIGDYAEANSTRATAIGAIVLANGSHSTAFGSFTTANGDFSTAMNNFTTAQSYMSTVVGTYNVVSGSSSSWVSTDPLFVVGNGTEKATNNALTVLKNGNTNIDGEINRTPTGSANMVPIAYGYINSSGSVNTGTGNVSCTWNSSSLRYEITITSESYYYNDYITTVTGTNASYTSGVSSGGGKMLVFFKNSSGTNVQNNFQFITYKP